MATKEKKEKTVKTVEEREYRFYINNDATGEGEEVTLKESELTNEHNEAMFVDMWEYYESASRTAQQLFLLKLQMSDAELPSEAAVTSAKKIEEQHKAETLVPEKEQ